MLWISQSKTFVVSTGVSTAFKRELEEWILMAMIDARCRCVSRWDTGVFCLNNENSSYIKYVGSSSNEITIIVRSQET